MSNSCETWSRELYLILAQDERQQLRWKLDYGDITRVANKTRCNRSTVSRFFSWNTSDYQVLKAILELIKEREELVRGVKRGNFV